ncbi:hypothetical protein Zmor_015078 [Zophobas morio]|uniref:CCHC-type domain-containing protein n=1 Tax=Zophobas morio TaxID=2755281 RepID=A0AA38MGX6_9CUCU|nr:hypothetical protein Zmor_015078 [Zophobas morio]
MRDGGSVKEFLMEFDRVLYDLKQAGGKMDDDEVIIQLLSAMPNDYRAVVTSIDILFSKDPKSISLEFVKRKLLEEERRSQCEPTNTERTESGQAFSATFSKSKTHPRFNNGYNGKKFHYDNRVGNASHLVKVKNGGSSSAGQGQAQFESRGNFSGKCYQCGGRGHRRSECPSRKLTSHAHLTDEQHGGRKYNPKNNDSYDIAFLTQKNNDKTEWPKNVREITFVVDSGATSHLVKREFLNYVTSVTESSRQIHVAKEGEAVNAKYCGDLAVTTMNDMKLTLLNVQVCDELSFNLMSVKCMEEKGLTVRFENKQVVVFKNKSIILRGERVGGLYLVKLNLHEIEHASTVIETSDLWHRRMGHSSKYPVKDVCEVCLQGKQQDQRNVIIDLPNQISDTHMSESETSDEEIITMEENIAHRSRREKRLPKYLDDYEIMLALSAGHLPSEVPQSYEEAVKDDG